MFKTPAYILYKSPNIHVIIINTIFLQGENYIVQFRTSET